jgi:hypothetical protein
VTEPERAEVLAELGRRYPHWRIGQLVANAAGWADAEIWDVEDETLLAAVRAHLNGSNGPPEPRSGPGQPVHLTGTA